MLKSLGRGLLSVVSALAIGGSAFAADPILPDSNLTPGVVDRNVQGSEICDHDWAPGSPPTKGGNRTYSQAARATPQAVKEQAFEEYGITDPHDGGASYEIDHRLPLSLGGRDVLQNLWPETRNRSVQWNAWVKDRLELKLYNLVCHVKPGETPVSLSDAQAAFLGDWTAAYQQYCLTEADCPSYAGSEH
jgi:hypothetical protein